MSPTSVSREYFSTLLGHIKVTLKNPLVYSFISISSPSPAFPYDVVRPVDSSFPLTLIIPKSTECRSEHSVLSAVSTSHVIHAITPQIVATMYHNNVHKI